MAETIDYIFYIPRIVFLGILIVIIFVMLSVFASKETNTATIEMEILLESVMNSDMIMYQDPYTMRVYPGVVDKKKFEEIDFSQAISSERQNLGMRVTLQGEEPLTKYYVQWGEDTEEEFSIATTISAVEQAPVILYEPVRRHVSIKDGDKINNGVLEIQLAVLT